MFHFSLYFMCMSVLPACVSVPRAWSTYGSQKKVSDALRLVLHLVVSSRVAVRNLKERPVLVTTEPYLWLHEFAS